MADIEVGDRVRATIPDLSQPTSEREIIGTVLDVLSTQLVVQEDEPGNGFKQWDKGYRFVMKRGEWTKL